MKVTDLIIQDKEEEKKTEVEKKVSELLLQVEELKETELLLHGQKEKETEILRRGGKETGFLQREEEKDTED